DEGADGRLRRAALRRSGRVSVSSSSRCTAVAETEDGIVAVRSASDPLIPERSARSRGERQREVPFAPRTVFRSRSKQPVRGDTSTADEAGSHPALASRRKETIMHAKGLTPILNVSDIVQSFAWFEKLGWKKGWDWGSPPTFGCVCSGECEVFL